MMQSWVKKVWQTKGFNQQTEIQRLLMEPLENGESLLATSPTGTGKTLAYLLPLLTKIDVNEGLQLLVIAPSQELAKQIATVAQDWTVTTDIKIQLMVGGANFKRQQEALKDKPHVIIATPGRFLELQQKTRKLKLHQVKAIVFDEADYLAQAEHQASVQTILKLLMRSVQQVWISATMTEELKMFVGDLPLYKAVENSENSFVQHHYLFTVNRQKLTQLKRLAQVENMNAIVFFDQVNELESVAAKLVFQGISVAVLHGQLSKQERELAIRQMQQHAITFLLTTDVAARGLDLPNVPYIIHYDRVQNVETYVHRSGRTGRMGKSGTVISLVNEQEWRDLMDILQPLNLDLTPRMTYKGELVDPHHIHKESTVVNDGKETKLTQQPNPKHSKNSKTRNSTKQATTKKAKKKNRQRDTKNKGKRQKRSK